MTYIILNYCALADLIYDLSMTMKVISIFFQGVFKVHLNLISVTKIWHRIVVIALPSQDTHV
jgi:hypothetical protein